MYVLGLIAPNQGGENECFSSVIRNKCLSIRPRPCRKIVAERARSNRQVVVVFHFVVLTKTRIGSAYVARNKVFVLANLMHNRIVIVENTRVQLLTRLSKYCA